jgi:hypothetical protein
MVKFLAYLGAGLDCFLDEEATLGEVVGHAGRRGQLTHGLFAESEELSAKYTAKPKIPESYNSRHHVSPGSRPQS